MTADVVQQLGITVGGVVATIAGCKVQIKDLERRVTKIERCQEDMPNDYVPRRELSHTLNNLAQNMTDLRTYVRMIARRSKPRKETTKA